MPDQPRTAGGFPDSAAGRSKPEPGARILRRHAAVAIFEMEQISFEDFLKVELRVGRIVSAERFPEARKPAYKLEVDFGPEIGVKRSSAQITALYGPEELVGRLVVGVVNFPPKRIGPLLSECLVTGFHDENGDVALCVPDRPVPLGSKLL